MMSHSLPGLLEEFTSRRRDPVALAIYLVLLVGTGSIAFTIAVRSMTPACFCFLQVKAPLGVATTIAECRSFIHDTASRTGILQQKCIYCRAWKGLAICVSDP